MSQISEAAVSAREAARANDGRFGASRTRESGHVQLSPDGLSSVDPYGDDDDVDLDDLEAVLRERDDHPLSWTVKPGGEHTLTDDSGNATETVVVTGNDDGTFTASARPSIDVTSFAPAGMSDDEAGDWAARHDEVFDDFVHDRYGLDVVDDGYLEMDAVHYQVVSQLRAGARTSEAVQRLRKEHAGLDRLDADFADGTITTAWQEHLGAAPQ